MQDRTLQHTIELIHDTARDAGSWAEVGQQLQQLLGLDGWHLMRMNRGGTEVLTAGGERVSASAAERYDAHYGHIDPRLDLLRQAPPGTLCCDQDHFDDRFIARSEFYQDFLLPEGLRYVLGSRITTHDGPLHGGYLMGLLRGPERGVFAAETQALVHQLMPHLQRAFALKDQLEQLHERVAMLEAAVASTGPAVMTLDAEGRIRQADARAQAWLRAGSPVHSRHGRLQVTPEGLQPRLRQAIADCTRTRQPQALALALPGHTLTISPLQPTVAGRDVGSHSVLLCLISPTLRPRLPSEAQLKTLHGLTRAEARLARALTAGLTLEEHARRQDVRPATARSQLLAVFAKTGTHRQSELVRLIGAIPVTDPATDDGAAPA
jgi:DNA-binding CsgD family transcriptional regulator